MSKAASAEEAKPTEGPKGKTVEFTDVDTNAYYYEAVQWAVQKGITSGTSETTFSPDKPCTRAQTIVFLWRAAGSPEPKGKSTPFSDTKETANSYKAVLWAAERGIVSGDSFKPDDAVTRAQVATFLYRNAGSPAVTGGDSFSDVPADAYFAKPVTWVPRRGLPPERRTTPSIQTPPARAGRLLLSSIGPISSSGSSTISRAIMQMTIL